MQRKPILAQQNYSLQEANQVITKTRICIYIAKNKAKGEKTVKPNFKFNFSSVHFFANCKVTCSFLILQ